MVSCLNYFSSSESVCCTYKCSFSCIFYLEFSSALLVLLNCPCMISARTCYFGIGTFFCITFFFSNFFQFDSWWGLYLRLLYFLNYRWYKILFVVVWFDVIVFFISSYSFSSIYCCRIDSVSLILMAVCSSVLSLNERNCYIKTNKKSLRLNYQLSMKS